MAHQQRKTIFYCGEGKSDLVFIGHLVNLFADKRFVSVAEPASSNGGSSDVVILEAFKRTNNILYAYKIIIVDNDKLITRGLYEEALKDSGDRNFKFLLPPYKNTELEAWLHFIKDKDYKLKGGYKKDFYSKYKTEKTDVLTVADCRRLFPKPLLKEASKHCDRLNALITLLSTGEWIGYADEDDDTHPNLTV